MVERFPTILRAKDHMLLAVPRGMAESLAVWHDKLPLGRTLSGSPEGVCRFDSRNCQTVGVPRQSRGFTSIKINRPVRLESTGGVVRIGNMTNDPPGLPPFVAAASAPSLVVNSDLPPLLDKVVEWLLAEGVEYGLTGALIYFGMEPSTATSLASFLADELAPVIRTAILPDGTAAAGGVTLELPPSYEYCRHVI